MAESLLPKVVEGINDIKGDIGRLQGTLELSLDNFSRHVEDDRRTHDDHGDKIAALEADRNKQKGAFIIIGGLSASGVGLWLLKAIGILH